MVTPAVLHNPDQYFQTARERYRIKLKRDAGEPPPWTTDRHFQEWRFCNVHREDDRTTIWFRNNIRNPVSAKFLETRRTEDYVNILRSTLIFRWFNRIETGEIIKDLLLGEWNTEEARLRLMSVSPIVTGAFIIKAGDGVSKLDGILDCVDEAIPQLPKMVASWGDSLQQAWADIKELHFMGGFMSYEVVSDLRWTPLLDYAKDIMTWANAGPGCARGLGWVAYGNLNHFNCGARNQRIMLDLMQQLLAMSKEEQYWPQSWKQWEMREVEHWCCEFDKMKRAEGGQRLKRRYQCNS